MVEDLPVLLLLPGGEGEKADSDANRYRKARLLPGAVCGRDGNRDRARLPDGDRGGGENVKDERLFWCDVQAVSVQRGLR